MCGFQDLARALLLLQVTLTERYDERNFFTDSSAAFDAEPTMQLAAA